MGGVSIQIGLRTAAGPDHDAVGGDVERPGGIDSIDDEIDAGSDHGNPLAAGRAGKPAHAQRHAGAGKGPQTPSRGGCRSGHRRRWGGCKFGVLRLLHVGGVCLRTDGLHLHNTFRRRFVDRRSSRRGNDAGKLKLRIAAGPEPAGPCRTAERGGGASRVVAGGGGADSHAACHAHQHAPQWRRKNGSIFPLRVAIWIGLRARILLNPDHRLVGVDLSRSLDHMHAAGQMPDIVGALRPARGLTSPQRDAFGGIDRRHFDATCFSDRSGQPPSGHRCQHARWRGRGRLSMRHTSRPEQSQHERPPDQSAPPPTRADNSPQRAGPAGNRRKGWVEARHAGWLLPRWESSAENAREYRSDSRRRSRHGAPEIPPASPVENWVYHNLPPPCGAVIATRQFVTQRALGCVARCW